jgi:hypothetical protein
MSAGKVYRQAIKRVFAEKYHDERMAVYRGREDDTIHVITSLRHYVHKIATANEDTLEFVRSVGDSVTVKLTDDERRELPAQPACVIRIASLDFPTIRRSVSQPGPAPSQCPIQSRAAWSDAFLMEAED